MSETQAEAIVREATLKYEHLGMKTFWIFFSEGATPAIIIGLVAVFTSFFTQYEPMKFLFTLSSGFFLFILIGTALVSYLRYSRYEYLLDIDALRIKRGVLHKEEIAIPYRQIQHVEIDRPLLYQLTGVSKLTILTAADNDDNLAHQKEGVIPAIDKKLATALQSTLLSKANIQKIAMHQNV